MGGDQKRKEISGDRPHIDPAIVREKEETGRGFLPREKLGKKKGKIRKPRRVEESGSMGVFRKNGRLGHDIMGEHKGGEKGGEAFGPLHWGDGILWIVLQETELRQGPEWWKDKRERVPAEQNVEGPTGG